MNRAKKRRQRQLTKKSQRSAPAGGQPAGNVPDIQQALDLAVQHHTAGRLSKAESIYQQILQADPNQAAALHFLGVIAHQMGKNDIAVDLITKAIIIKPKYVDPHNNLGNVLKELGKLDDAVASYYKAIALKPDYSDAHSNLGLTLQKLGDLDESRASYLKALAIDPNHVEAWSNLRFAIKVLLFSKGSGDRAEEVGVYELNDAARATVGYAIHQYYQAGFRPHEADESFKNVIAALPAKTDETITISGSGQRSESLAELPNKLVALFHFGRSGTGLLHSLIDGHPEISTLPSIYLRGFFNAGVWDKIAADRWRGLPERFADVFAVMFDANSPNPVPSRLGDTVRYLGRKEGMTAVGENRDEALSLDREKFCSEALRLMGGLDIIDPWSFLMVIHAAYEKVLGTKTKKHTVFYHIHNPDEFSQLNFLRYAPDARLVVMVREPIQSCESWILNLFKQNDYDKIIHRILDMFFGIDRIIFRKQESIGVRLEDLKTRPKATMRALCAWLGVKETPSLCQMTAQGKKWWGDPSSPEYDASKDMSPFYKSSINRATGTVFSERDQFVLGTLFYPFSVRFAYREPEPEQFQKDLKEIRPFLDELFDFETVILERLRIDPAQFKRRGDYLLLRAGLVDRWDVLLRTQTKCRTRKSGELTVGAREALGLAPTGLENRKGPSGPVCLSAGLWLITATF